MDNFEQKKFSICICYRVNYNHDSAQSWPLVFNFRTQSVRCAVNCMLLFSRSASWLGYDDTRLLHLGCCGQVFLGCFFPFITTLVCRFNICCVAVIQPDLQLSGGLHLCTIVYCPMTQNTMLAQMQTVLCFSYFTGTVSCTLKLYFFCFSSLVPSIVLVLLCLSISWSFSFRAVIPGSLWSSFVLMGLFSIASQGITPVAGCGKFHICKQHVFDCYSFFQLSLILHVSYLLCLIHQLLTFFCFPINALGCSGFIQ